jgi:bidirectional [NiFe] hydrogenase diaphorase subunit
VSVHTLTIDGTDVAAEEGRTVLDVARENGVDIPTLCHLDGLCDVGSCRLCVVEVDGSGRLTPACMTPVREGMRVETTNERIDTHRRTVVEMLFAERNHVCAVCVANNHCELQDRARDLGMRHVDLPSVEPSLGIDASHRLFAIDHNRCILCTRCVRVCDEVEGAHTWDVAGRGLGSRVVTDLGMPWGESPTCTSCGKCVQVCPTGALFEKGRSVAEGSKDRRRFLPYLREHSTGATPGPARRSDSRPSGWTAARAATCPSWTWTSGCSRSPTSPTS